jgi:hypothetical protein
MSLLHRVSTLMHCRALLFGASGDSCRGTQMSSGFDNKLDRAQRRSVTATAAASDSAGRSLSDLAIRNPAPDAAPSTVPSDTYREITVSFGHSSGTT